MSQRRVKHETSSVDGQTPDVSPEITPKSQKYDHLASNRLPQSDAEVIRASDPSITHQEGTTKHHFQPSTTQFSMNNLNSVSNHDAIDSKTPSTSMDPSTPLTDMPPSLASVATPSGTATMRELLHQHPQKHLLTTHSASVRNLHYNLQLVEQMNKDQQNLHTSHLDSIDDKSQEQMATEDEDGFIHIQPKDYEHYNEDDGDDDHKHHHYSALLDQHYQQFLTLDDKNEEGGIFSLKTRPLTRSEYLDIQSKKDTSLDYHDIVNNIFAIRTFSQNRQQDRWVSIFRWLVSLSVGLITGAIGIALRTWNMRMNDYKFRFTNDQLQDGNYLYAWIIFVCINTVCISIASSLVVFFEPKANGSGILDMKAYINGSNNRGVFTAKTLFTKVIATAFTIVSGAPTGLQGPMIHIGALIGAWFSQGSKKFVKRLCCCAKEDQETRDLEDIPLIPNPIPPHAYTLGYYQRVEHVNLDGDDDRSVSYPPDANDILLIQSGLIHDSANLLSTASKLSTARQKRDQQHGTQAPASLELLSTTEEQMMAAPGFDRHVATTPTNTTPQIVKPGEARNQAKLMTCSGEMISAEHVENLTIDGDIVPITSTGRRKMAQVGLLLEPTSNDETVEMTDFQKRASRPKPHSHSASNRNIFRSHTQLRTGTAPQKDSVPTPASSKGDGAAPEADGGGLDLSRTHANDIVLVDDHPESTNQQHGARFCPRPVRNIPVPSFSNDLERRDFITLGAAAGVSSVLGAVVGSLLYVYEELAAKFSIDLSFRVICCALFASVTAAFIGVGINHSWGSFLPEYYAPFFVGRRAALYTVEELPVFILVGVLGGLIGSLYIFTSVNFSRWRNTMHGTRKWTRVLDTVLLIIFWSTVVFAIPMLWPCQVISPDYAAAEALSNGASAGTYRQNLYDCPAGYHNKMADLAFGRVDLAVKRLMARGIPNSFDIPEVLIWFVLFFLSTSSITNMNACFGIVVPMLMLGSSYGRAIGIVSHKLFGSVNSVTNTVYFDPGIFAAAGCTAMFASVNRTSLSMSIILLEITADLNLILPLFLSAFVSHIVASYFTIPVTHIGMRDRRLPYLLEHPPAELNKMTCRDLMHPNPIRLGSTESVEHILLILESCKHNGFPVVLEPCTSTHSTSNDARGHRGEGCDNNFLGIVLRHQLLVLINRRVWRATSPPFTIEDYDRAMSRAAPRLSELRARLTALDLASKIDLIPWINRSPLLVSENTLGMHAYQLFQQFGLRHLCVIDTRKEVTGLITRLELLEPVIKHRYAQLLVQDRKALVEGKPIRLREFIENNTAYRVIKHHREGQRQYRRIAKARAGVILSPRGYNAALAKGRKKSRSTSSQSQRQQTDSDGDHP